jgi:hypothetical protein
MADPGAAVFSGPFVVPPLVAVITATIARTATIKMGNKSRLRVIDALLTNFAAGEPTFRTPGASLVSIRQTFNVASAFPITTTIRSIIPRRD